MGEAACFSHFFLRLGVRNNPDSFLVDPPRFKPAGFFP